MQEDNVESCARLRQEPRFCPSESYLDTNPNNHSAVFPRNPGAFCLAASREHVGRPPCLRHPGDSELPFLMAWQRDFNGPFRVSAACDGSVVLVCLSCIEYIYICIYVYLSMYIYIYIFIFIHAHIYLLIDLFIHFLFIGCNWPRTRQGQPGSQGFVESRHYKVSSSEALPLSSIA